jgi:hypothetical protein
VFDSMVETSSDVRSGLRRACIDKRRANSNLCSEH